MNRKGLSFFVGLMIGLVFILLGLAFAPAIKGFTDSAMGPSTDTTVGLDCTNSTITNFDKANCLFVDYMNPIFVGFLIFAGGVIATAKILS